MDDTRNYELCKNDYGYTDYGYINDTWNYELCKNDYDLLDYRRNLKRREQLGENVVLLLLTTGITTNCDHAGSLFFAYLSDL